MKQILLLSILLIGVNILVLAQTFQNVIYDDSLSLEAYDVKKDDDRIYICGAYLDENRQPVGGLYMTFDYYGNVTRQTRIKPNNNSKNSCFLALTATPNVPGISTQGTVIVGYQKDSIYSGTVTRLNFNGDVFWSKEFREVDSITNVIFTNDNNILIVGTSKENKLFSAKLKTQDGALIWAKKLDTQEYSASSVIEEGNNFLITLNAILGASSGILTLDQNGAIKSADSFFSTQKKEFNSIIPLGDKTHISSGKTNKSFILNRYNISNNNSIWAKYYSLANHDIQGYTIAGLEDNAIISAIYDYTPFEQQNRKAILLLNDADGTKIWSKQYGTNATNYFRKVEKISDSTYLAVGASGDTNKTGVLIIQIDSTGQLNCCNVNEVNLSETIENLVISDLTLTNSSANAPVSLSLIKNTISLRNTDKTCNKKTSNKYKINQDKVILCYGEVVTFFIENSSSDSLILTWNTRTSTHANSHYNENSFLFRNAVNYRDTVFVRVDIEDYATKCVTSLSTFFIRTPNSEVINTITICKGDSIFLQKAYRNKPGIYIDTLSSPYSLICHEILMSSLFIEDNIVENVVKNICQGDSVFLQNAFRTLSGEYIDTVQQNNTCQKILKTTLTVTPTPIITSNLSICQGDSVLINNIYRKVSGTYLDTLYTTATCDTVVKTELNVIPINITNIDTSFCTGDSIKIGQKYVFDSGTYDDTVYSVFLPCGRITRYNIVKTPILYGLINHRDTVLCDTQNQISLSLLIEKSGAKNGVFKGLNNSAVSGNYFSPQNLGAGEYLVQYTEKKNCSIDSAIIKIKIVNKPIIGTDSISSICNTLGDINLFSYLSGAPESGGFWTSTSVSQAGLSQGLINTVNLNTGSYNFYYQKPLFTCPKDSVKVTLMVQKQAISGGDITLNQCEGTKEIDLNTYRPSTASKDGVWLNSNIIFSATGILNSSKLLPGSYTYTYFISGNGICIDDSIKALVNIIAAPTGKITATNDKICQDSTLTLNLAFTGVGPFNSKLTNSVYSKILSNHGSTVSYDTTLSQNEQFILSNTIDLGTGCAALQNDTLAIIVYQPLEAILLEENCDNDLNTFSVLVELVGGDSSSYKVNNIPFTGNTYRLNGLQNGGNYKLTFTDATQCSESVVDEEKFCKCISQAGTMDLNLRNFCENDTAKGTQLLYGTLDNNDTSIYVLHDKAGISLGNVIAYNNKPEFNFTTTIQYNKTYYISNVVTSKTSASVGFDEFDTCYAISRGTPVRWQKIPSGLLLKDTAICNGQNAVLAFRLNGNGPFNVLFNNGIKDTLYEKINDNYSFDVTPINTSTFTIKSIGLDLVKNCVSNVNSTINIAVNPLPNAKISGNASFCETESTDIIFDLTGTAPFLFNYQINGIDQGQITATSNTYILPSSQPGLYRLNKVSDANCLGLVSDEVVELTVKKSPLANAGIDQAICGRSTELFALPSIGFGTWSDTSNKARFANLNNSNSAVIVPQSGSYIFTWTETNPPCLPSSDNVKVVFTDMPLTDAGNDTVICSNFLKLNADKSIGQGTWISSSSLLTFTDANNQNSLLKADKPGTYELIWRESVADICVDSDTLLITFLDSIKIQVDSIVCNENASYYTPYLSISGGGNSTYNVNGFASINSFHYLNFESGSDYKFEIRDSTVCSPTKLIGNYTCPCVSDAGTLIIKDTIEICYNEVAVITENFDYSADPDDDVAYILHDGSSDSIGSILIYSSTNRFEYKPILSYNKVYYLSRIVGNKSNSPIGISLDDRCFDWSNGQAIMFKAPLVLNSLSTYSFCEATEYKLNLSTSDTGKFILGYSENNIPKIAEISGKDFSLIINPKLGINNYSFTDLNSAYNQSCALFNNKILTVIVNPKPNVQFNVLDSVCIDQVITTVSTNTDDILNWDFGNNTTISNVNNPSIKYAFPGKYSIKLNVTSKFGCTDSLTKEITVGQAHEADFTINNSKDTVTFCLPSELELSSLNPNIMNRSWLVNGVLTTNSNLAKINYTTVNTGYYNITLKEINEFSCTAEKTKTVRIIEPTGDLIIDQTTICSGASLKIKLISSLDVDSTSISIFYQSGKESILGNQADYIYTVPKTADKLIVKAKLFTIEGCLREITKDVVLISVKADFTVNSLATDTIYDCLFPTKSYMISGISSNSASHQWLFENGLSSNLQFPENQIFTKVGLNKISLTVKDSSGLCSDEKTKYIYLYDKPNIELEVENDTLCALNEYRIALSGAQEYEWNPETFLTNFTPNKETAIFATDTSALGAHYSYVISGTDQYGCSNTITRNINIRDLKQQNDTIIDIEIISGESVNINLNANPAYQYLWTPNYKTICTNCSEQILTPDLSQTYNVLVTDIYGCYESKFTYNITVDERISIDMPDAFSPNGDNINETIWPDGFGITNIQSFQIFNNTGNLLHSTSGKLGPSLGWDGKYLGKTQNSGNYYYTITANTSINLQAIIIKGSFMLLR